MDLAEDSIRFLISKKIAQLLKLVNHLSSQIADQKYAIEQYNKNFESEIGSLAQQIQNRIDESANGVMNSETIEETKKVYEPKYKNLLDINEADTVDFQSQLTEVEVSVKHQCKIAMDEINKITEMLNSQLNNFEHSFQSNKSDLDKRISRANNRHEQEIQAVEIESQNQLKSIEQQTGRKLDDLDRDFNRSLNDLKQKFGGIITSSTNSLPLKDPMIKNQVDIIDIKEIISSKKTEVEFFISNTSAILKETKKKSALLAKHYMNMGKSHQEELNKIKSQIESEEIQNQNTSQCIQDETKTRLEDYQKKIEELQLQLQKNKEEHSIIMNDERKSLQKQAKSWNVDEQSFQNNLKAELGNVINNHKFVEENIIKKISCIEQNIKDLGINIEKTQKELIQSKKDAQSEESLLSTQLTGVFSNSEMEFEKKEEEIRKKINEEIEKAKNSQEILNAKQQVKVLELEKQKLLDEYSKESEEKIDYTELDDTLSQLKKDLEEDMKQIKEDEEVFIKALKDQHNNEKNARIRERNHRIESSLDEIRSEYDSNEKIKEELDKYYKEQLRSLEAELNDTPEEEIKLSEKDFDDDEITSVFSEKEKHLAKVTIEKQELIAEWLRQQKEEEDRYLRHLAQIDLLQIDDGDEDKDKFRNEFSIRIHNLNQKIHDLENELAEAQTKQIPQPSSVESVFDKEEQDLRKEYNILKAKCDKALEKALANRDAAWADVKQKMKIIQDKIKKISNAAKRQAKKTEAKISDASEEANEEFESIKNKTKRSLAKMRNDHKHEVHKLNRAHGKAASELNDAINAINDEIIDFDDNPIPNPKKNQYQLEEKIKRNDANFLQEIEMLKAENRCRVVDLEKKISSIKAKMDKYINAITNNEPRDQDNLKIQLLEEQLKIKTQHVLDITNDLKEYKSKLVQQEGVYNSHFGATPQIAVLRPKTAKSCGLSSNRRNKNQRPYSAMTKVRNLSSYMKVRPHNNEYLDQ